ncbi:MAG TPA: gfo/Idh/MocA family oxidoreductase [Verrucomicrobiales bacterium]|nr:gfo/Idh/MocA family oxidoreductase [Verrucomicrobiales bacterium]HRJ07972.1 Gfo/Idh/MocA family oxidoreductase [Prosthecobacter sp.]HRK14096.1 Gfo/Idh/MocA family oxidoreductase [Prosthecobacter sp.]
MALNIISRRHFLGRTAGLAASAFAGPNLLLRGQEAAGRRLNIAIIGANGKGQSDTQAVTLDHNIVALVDVDMKRLEEAGKKNADHHLKSGKSEPRAPKLYQDYRKMFDEMANEIDAVIVSTPDHTHFTAAMHAIKLKKHVCVQKPLCNYINEVRELHQAARQAGVVTQMGNQGRTMEGQRLAKEWIEQGAIGTLKEIRLWTNRPIWPQGPLAKKAAECPPNLDWDLWLSSEADESYFEFVLPEGVTNKRSGNSIHPFAWRGWWQFGSGALGDMGCHIMDATFSVLGQLIPEKIDAVSSPISTTCAPVWSDLVYHMPAGKHPALKVSWNDGSKDGMPNKPEISPHMTSDLAKKAFEKASSGMMFIGTEATVFEGEAYCSSPVIYNEERYTQVRLDMKAEKIKKTEARSVLPNNPQGEWAWHIVNGGSPSSNFDYSCPLTEFVLLGNLAVRAQQTVQWDKEGMKVPNAESANQFVTRPAYRPGWKV